jgi:hypothetical protein
MNFAFAFALALAYALAYAFAFAFVPHLRLPSFKSVHFYTRRFLI